MWHKSLSAGKFKDVLINCVTIKVMKHLHQNDKGLHCTYILTNPFASNNEIC